MIQAVSILIPVYNCEEFIAETIESILCQSFSNFELLIADDGSKDKSLEIIKDYAKKDSRITFFSEPNKGKCAVLNYLVPIAKNDWCVFIDHDDVMMPDRLEKQIKFHNENPSLLASSSHCYFIDSKNNLIGKQVYFGLSNEEEFHNKYLNKEFITVAFTALMVNKNCFIELGGLRKEFWPSDDLDFTTRFVSNGYKLLIINEYLMKYRIHPNGTTTSKAIECAHKLRYTSHCCELRKKGLPEITFDSFMEDFEKKKKVDKIRFWKIFYASQLLRIAGFSYYRKNYLPFIFHLLPAFLLRPKLVLNSIKNQSKKNSLYLLSICKSTSNFPRNRVGYC